MFLADLLDLKEQRESKLASNEKIKADFPGKVCDINGARVEFDDGWGLIRASSNMPELVLIFEATTRERMLEIRELIKSYTRQYPEICDKWDNDVE